MYCAESFHLPQLWHGFEKSDPVVYGSSTESHHQSHNHTRPRCREERKGEDIKRRGSRSNCGQGKSTDILTISIQILGVKITTTNSRGARVEKSRSLSLNLLEMLYNSVTAITYLLVG